MGSLLSKDSNKQQESTFDKSTPSKPILTPNSRISEIDPRSPSTNICRTPIQITGTPIKEPSVHDTFNLNSPGVNTILLDPRSPAVEFIRTPIVAQEKKPTTLRNKNLDNVLLKHTPKQRKPRLLDSTPINITPMNLSKRKSFAGYLETNLDFVETNLDEVVLRKSLSNLCTKSDYTPIKSFVNYIENEVHIKDEESNNWNTYESGTENKNLNVSTENNESNSEMQNIIDDIIDAVFKMEDIKMDIIPRIVAISPKPRKIIKSFDKKMKELIAEESKLNFSNYDYSVCEEILSKDIGVMENEVTNDNKDVTLQMSENIIVYSNNKDKLEAKYASEETKVAETLINKLPIENIDMKAAQKGKERGITARRIRMPRGIKDTNNQEKTILRDVERHKRVPLTDRNGSNKIRSIPKLRVNDKPRQSQYSVSKIPQFKGKGFAKGPLVQCENTPPTKNASVWDNEETLII